MATTAKKLEDFPIAPPEQAVFEASASISDRLQGFIHRLNDKGGETGWRFALVQGGGKEDLDGVTRLKAVGYVPVSKAEVEQLGNYLGESLPLQLNETLMRKPYKQFVADKARSADLRAQRRPQSGMAQKIGDAEGGVSSPEAVATSTVIKIQSKD